MARPSLAIVAPLNLSLRLMVEDISTQLKVLVAGSKTPTQLALHGANIARPLPVMVAPVNLASTLMVEEMSMQLKALVTGLNTPTQSA